MRIDIPFIKHIAELSRIRLKEKEVKKFTPQMKTILESVDILKEVDTENVNPMKKHISFCDLRDDNIEESLKQGNVLKNAPHTQNGFVKVYGSVFGESSEG